jgi:hypothetical protein
MTTPAVVPPTTPETSTTQQPDSNVDPFAAEREALSAKIRQEVLTEAAQTYNPALSEANRERDRLAQRVQELEQARNTPTPQDDDPSAFLANPQSSIRDIIQKELAATVGPLNDFRAQIERQNGYASIKAQLKMHPQFSAIIPQVEGYLDAEAMNLNPLNPGAVAGLAMTILGQITAGFRQPLIAQAPTPTPQRGNPLPNPTIPSSPPVAPPVKQGNEIVLTETERRVAKMQGFPDTAEGHKLYIAFRDNDGRIDTLRGIGATP